MAKSNFALRLQTSLMDEVKKVARKEGVAVNQFINVAVAEKLSALRTAEFFAERSRPESVAEAIAILQRAGHNVPPIEGDELH